MRRARSARPLAVTQIWTGGQHNEVATDLGLIVARHDGFRDAEVQELHQSGQTMSAPVSSGRSLLWLSA